MTGDSKTKKPKPDSLENKRTPAGALGDSQRQAISKKGQSGLGCRAVANCLGVLPKKQKQSTGVFVLAVKTANKQRNGEDRGKGANPK